MELLCEYLPITVENTMLRKFVASDVASFHNYRADADLARFQGWTTMTSDEAEKFILEMSFAVKLNHGQWLQLAIACPFTDKLFGDVGLHLDSKGLEAEIGFTLAKPHQGCGHAVRALNAAMSLIGQTTLVESVKAITDSRNLPSISVLKRSGFVKVSEEAAIFKNEECIEHTFEKRRFA